MPTWKKRKRKTGIDSKAAKDLLMFSLLSFVPRDEIRLEYRFHPVRKWRWDYAVPSLMLAIEYHGGIYSGGRHVRGIGFENDREKINTGQLDGWMILEVTSDMIASGSVHDMIGRAIDSKRRGQ